ncbi:hypothetical protein ACH5RR_033839 [Cinchona calisaya]|uniref:Uncharacterized protein n=1 Tax=Cinchona calisaya TaxID=153742 RepID=A0ABD2Y953_9GENT
MKLSSFSLFPSSCSSFQLSFIYTSNHIFQVFTDALSVSNSIDSLAHQIAAKHAQGDAARHQERMCAREHARPVVQDATAFHQELMAIRKSVHAMPI